MTIQCLYCRQPLELNEDTPEARKQRTDPYQQMRKHIVLCHASKIMEHTRNLGWLLDTLFFEMPADPARWRAKIAALIDHHYETAQGFVESEAPTAPSPQQKRL